MSDRSSRRRAGGEPAGKSCRACGRVITWRKKWADSWSEVRYCSDACRRRGVRRVDRLLETAIVDLLQQRGRGQTICPSEAARAVYRREAGSSSSPRSGNTDDTWRELMEPARAAARRLVADGRVEMLQQGRVVDPSTARGAIRVRLVDPG